MRRPTEHLGKGGHRGSRNLMPHPCEAVPTACGKRAVACIFDNHEGEAVQAIAREPKDVVHFGQNGGAARPAGGGSLALHAKFSRSAVPSPAERGEDSGCTARCTRTQCSKTVFLAAMEAVIAAVCPACLEYEANFDSQPLFDYTM